MGLLTTVIAATTEAGKSETPFFIFGIALALFAVAISVVGFTRPAWPNGEGRLGGSSVPARRSSSSSWASSSG